ncbi:PulJ/GspJ family protein [Alienimonas californiensis]|uniref:Prepilin-type N-terminal cleavage/methylation domain-containing protein n=1 Tax=Alienimonas californiensis TaxID=2527989 RepID=A0A517P8X6_9PLAN|nr:hypothetical protein [Alienimonas californiensis]QDT15829.1 hypothetical protein CA12_19240 [Alienimonas californiensis]
MSRHVILGICPPTCRGGVLRAPTRRLRRAGLTLLELVLAGALTAGMAASLHLVVRGVGTSWEQLNGETDALRAADGGLRFITRRCRSADAVAQIGAANGQFTVLAPEGHTLRFERNPGDGAVYLYDSRDGTGRILVEGTTGFATTFYQSDGVTATTDPAEAQMIDIVLTVALPRDVNAGRTVRGRVWVRRW